VLGSSELDEAETSRPGRFIDELKERRPPIDDVARATAWWAQFSRTGRHRGELPELPGAYGSGPHEPYRTPAKTGRNAPCPCGSGRKYKKCCGE
jgi:hypothetical protein